MFPFLSTVTATGSFNSAIEAFIPSLELFAPILPAIATTLPFEGVYLYRCLLSASTISKLPDGSTHIDLGLPMSFPSALVTIYASSSIFSPELLPVDTELPVLLATGLLGDDI